MAQTFIATKGDLYGPSTGVTWRDSAVLSSSASSPQGSAGSSGVPVTTLFGNLRASIFAQPITWLFGLVLALVAYKLIEEHRGGQEAFQEVKIGANNIWKIGLMALLFFALARWGASRVNVPGLSSFVLGATGGSN